MAKTVGYWFSKESPEYPMPLANPLPWKGQENLLDKLRSKQAKTSTLKFKGFSKCRICGKNNGSLEYTTGKFKWPEGYFHYIEKHNVVPPKDFYNWVMGK